MYEYVVMHSVLICVYFCRISNYVKDTAECGTLISLLLPFVSASKYKVWKEAICSLLLYFWFLFQKHQDRILVTLQNLLTSVEEVKPFFRYKRAHAQFQ